MLDNGDVPDFFPASQSVLGADIKPKYHRSQGFAMLNDVTVPTISLSMKKYDPTKNYHQNHVASKKSTVNIFFQDILTIPSLLYDSAKDEFIDKVIWDGSVALSAKSPNSSVANINEPCCVNDEYQLEEKDKSGEKQLLPLQTDDKIHMYNQEPKEAVTDN